MSVMFVGPGEHSRIWHRYDASDDVSVQQWFTSIAEGSPEGEPIKCKDIRM